MIDSGTLLQERFLIEEKIGMGGMGAVYRAIDQKFGSVVAIKRTFYGDAELAKAFEREARLLNGLHHPILPHVSDYFSENGDHFLVMEYIEGEDLSDLLKRGERFTVNTVLGWTLDLLDGLDYLHSQDPPVIHRDIKPHNMKLTSRGKIVLLDFGMAKETSSNTLATKSVFGYSRRYSPFEQIEGTGTDERADIFSLGASVYHLLTGEPPVDVLRRVSAIVAGKPDPLVAASLVNADIPIAVSKILNTALALNAEDRFESARAMWNALEHSIKADAEQQNHDSRFGDGAGLAKAAAAGLSGFVRHEQTGQAQTFTIEDDTQPSTPPLALEREVQVRSESSAFGSGPGSEDLKRTLGIPIPAPTSEMPIPPPISQVPVPGPISQIRIERPAAIVRPTKWLPILAVCLAVAFLAIYLGSRTGEDSVGENQPNTAIATSETLEATSSSDPTENAGASEVKTEEPQVNETSSARNQTPEPVTPRPNSVVQTAVRGRDSETKVTREPQPGISDRNRPVSAERARRVVKPAFEQPSVSSIEAIMSGVPYERRNRWADEKNQLTEEEIRRRQMRRIIRENRRRQQPF